MEHIAVMSEGFSEYGEKHSRFLGFIIPCKNENEATQIIAAKRKEYFDARHVVYAYVLSDGTARFSDDGEPHGTAGKPVLEVLVSSGIKNAILIVVRYFGGVLLGTGGLVRAYTAAAKEAIENSTKAKIVPADRFSVDLSYAEYDRLLFLLTELNADIGKPEFSDTVSFKFSVKSDVSEICLLKIREIFSSAVVPKFEKKTEIYEII